MWVALDLPSTDGRPGFFEPVFLRFDDGFFDYYDVRVPFNGIEHPHMHGVLVLAIFGFCLALAQFAAARKPLPAVLTVIAGAGWPATLYPFDSAFYGAVILAAVLWVLAVPAHRTPASGPRRGVGAGAGGRRGLDLCRARKDGLLSWENWDPNGPSRQVSVSYVWDANYGGIEFAKEKTTVLRIFGPDRGPLLAGDHTRPVRRRPLAREPDAALDRPRDRAAAERPTVAGPLAEPPHLGQAAGRGGRAP
jgi:hypothetical protein